MLAATYAVSMEKVKKKEMMALAGPFLTGTAYANKMLAMGGRQSGKRSGLHFGMDLGSKDTNVVAQIRGNQIQQIIVDDYSRLEDRICEFLSKKKPL